MQRLSTEEIEAFSDFESVADLQAWLAQQASNENSSFGEKNQ